DVNGLVARAKPADASDALLEAGRIPREVDVHDDRRALQVEPLAQHIGRDKERDTLGGRRFGVADGGRELSEDLTSPYAPPGDAASARGKLGDRMPTCHQQTRKSRHRRRILAECQNAPPGMSTA